MLRSDGPREPQHRPKRTHLNRNESLRSDKSERKVSFNKSVGVKHIPKGAKKPLKPGTLPKGPDEWQGFTQVSHEPVSLDSKQLIEAAEDLVRVVDTIDCDTAPTTPYYSLERSGKSKIASQSYQNRSGYPHHDYANVIVNPDRSRSNNLGSGSGGIRTNNHFNSNSRPNNINSNSRTGNTTTTTIPALPNNYNYQNYHNYNPSVKTTRNQIQKKLKNTDANRLQKPLRPLRSNSNSNSNPSLAIRNEQEHQKYKSVPDLRTTTYLNQDFDQRDSQFDQDRDPYSDQREFGFDHKQNPDLDHREYRNPDLDHRAYRDPEYDQRDRDFALHQKPNPDFDHRAYPDPEYDQRDRERRGNLDQRAHRFDYDQDRNFAQRPYELHQERDTDYAQRPYGFEQDRNVDSDRKAYRFEQERDPNHRYGYDQDQIADMSYQQRSDQHQRKVERIIQKFNQESTFFGNTPAVEPSDYNNHNSNQPFSYTRGRSPVRNDRSPVRDSRSPVRNDQSYAQVQRKRYSDDYSHRTYDPDTFGARTRDHNDYSAKIIITDERHDYYDDDHAYESYQIPDDLTGKSNRLSHDLNINMASVGVQTDQGPNRGRPRGRTTRQPVDHVPRGRSFDSTNRGPHLKPRNDQLYHHEESLTSATLVRQMNHNFGRSDRSPSPPTRVTTSPSRPTRYNVVPLLSDASDTEPEPKRPQDPLARIRTQVMARERQQEQEEAEEERNLPLRPQLRTPVRSNSLYDDRMTPLTIDEVDALSLVMEDNKKSLVVASESSKSHTTTTTRHTTSHRTRETESATRDQRKRETDTRQIQGRDNRHEHRIENRNSRSTTPRRDEEPKKKKEKEEVPDNDDDDEKKKKGEKKKKRKIKIKFFYDKPEPTDDKTDPLAKFEEFKGEDYDYDQERQDDNLNRSLSEKYTQEEGKKKKSYLSLGRDKKKGDKEQRGPTPTSAPYSSSSLGRPRGREKVRSVNNSNNNNYNNTRFSTLQQQSRGGRSRRSSGSVSSSPTPRPAKSKQPQPVKKPRYFGDTDLEDYSKPTTTTTTTRQPPQGPGDYRSLPSRVENKNSRRIVRRRSPNSSSQHNSSESEVDSHASKASRVSTGSNRSVYLHATAVADIPVRSTAGSSSRQTDRQSDRQTDRQTRKVTRSFSLLSPWKPRHYREKYEIDYERKTQLPPRPPRRPQQQEKQQQQQQQQKGSKLSTWLRRKRNKEAKGI